MYWKIKSDLATHFLSKIIFNSENEGLQWQNFVTQIHSHNKLQKVTIVGYVVYIIT